MVPRRTRLFADPAGRFLHDVILASADRFPEKPAIVDTSDGSRLTFSDYADTVDSCARNLVASGVLPGERIATYLPNWAPPGCPRA
jgi:long-chain acyl-CoA synthetase